MKRRSFLTRMAGDADARGPLKPQPLSLVRTKQAPSFGLELGGAGGARCSRSSKCVNKPEFNRDAEKKDVDISKAGFWVEMVGFEVSGG